MKLKSAKTTHRAKRLRHFQPIITTLVLTLLFITTGSLFAQRSASEWLQVGLSARTSDEKIAAFEQAVATDPNYVEAYFYLGLAYKVKGRYEDAEVALNKAYFKNPYSLTDDIKVRILYELGGVYLQLNKIRQAVDALKGARNLASGANALKGRISYDLGRAHVREGNYDLALREFEKGQLRLPQVASQYAKDIELARSRKSLNDDYKKANSLLLNERFEEALALYRQIEMREPNFKDVSEKIREAESARNAPEPTAAKLQQARNLASSGSNARAVRILNDILSDEPNNGPAKALLLQLQPPAPPQEQEKPAPRKAAKVDPAIESTYQQGIAAYNREQWREALTAFKKVIRVNSTYKNVDVLSRQAITALEREKLQGKIEKLYRQGIAHEKLHQWTLAHETFKEIAEKRRGYKDVDERLELARSYMTAEAEANKNLDSLLAKGDVAANDQDWARAVLIFEKISNQDPDYPGIADKLANARRQMMGEGSDESDSASGSSGLLITLATSLSLLILPAFGLFIFSPTLRARMYLIQGRYDRAALLYEKILDKHPERTRLYPILANIYLLENRRDAQAMKIFEVILKLNLFEQKRREINSIIARQYLTEGRTDENAIAVMERELVTKLNPPNGT